MGINLKIQNLKQNIAKEINDSNLPPGVTLMIINEFAAQLKELNNHTIEAEKKAEIEKETQENTN